MELRSFSHFHHIHAIKGGMMTKVLNINRGKPAMVFKKLTDIYESIYDKAQESLPTRWSREGLEGNIRDGCESKMETQVLYAERKLFNDEPEVSDSDREGDSDTEGQKSDVEADSMTIKQMMESCKKRKVRQSNSVDSSKEKLRTCSSRELNHSCLLSDEDDSDLDVALSIWQSKLSKRKKLKTKCDESKISTSSLHGQTIENSDPINIDQDLLPSSSDLAIPVDIKVETPETDVTEIQNTNCITDELSLLCDENVNSCLSSGPIGTDELFFGLELTASEKEAEYGVPNRVSLENVEGDESRPLQMVGESSTECVSEDNLEVHKPQHSDFPASETMEGQCTPSFVSNDSISEAISLTEEQCLGIHMSQAKSITHEGICQNNSEDMSAISMTGEQFSDTHISEGKPFTDEAICPTNGEIFTYLNGMADLNSLQLPEMSLGAEVRLTENRYKDRLAFDNEKGIPTESTSDCNLSSEHGGRISSKSTSDCNLSPDHGESVSTNSISDRNLIPDQHLISIDECPAKEKQPQMSDSSDSERNTSPDFHLNGSTDKFNQIEEPQRHPTRLLSTRTTISPTSQERLSKAMKSMQLQDKECKTCGGKPYFKQIKYKVGTAEGCDPMKRVYSDTYHEQNTRKSRKRSLHSTNTTKASHAHASMRSSTVQSCSDSAIAFTERQMQDIECLALKLTTQLKSMKAIVEDRIHVEGNKATSYKFNTDEVRTAIADATKAEASAKKWLSIMSRDCNRFCKIMKTSGHGSNASPTSVQKLKRKITFADEAGGELCEVRLFEDDMNAESSVENSPEKVRIS
ncbi:dentin sialophosphoprotein-like [Cucurbita pepo subsp. pepo]|uniref:dentin sialophosphoprotein-like n=1 Tax=Cucurbita pepo subsp. pepo TaxID=3664 RepID=UPI000C9D9156|nr:dentin sialophosphoprotein-like [Cucurbita pepo subsp. pepo]